MTAERERISIILLIRKHCKVCRGFLAICFQQNLIVSAIKTVTASVNKPVSYTGIGCYKILYIEIFLCMNRTKGD